MFKADGKASRSQKNCKCNKAIFVSGIAKPIKVHAEINRAFNQKKQNPIRDECDRGFAAFCCRETAT